jgi:epoxyqueuosine reductase
MGLTEQIKQKALDLGFDLVGITDAEPLHPDYINRLLGWLDAGYAGSMTWMHQNLEKRVNPAKLLPGAQSVIVVGLNYKSASSIRSDEAVQSEAKDLSDSSSLSLRAEQAQRSEAKQSQPSGRIAAFAHYQDYHPFMKKHLRLLVDFLVSRTGPGLKFKICVDSTPLLERAFAVRAGLGFIGKNHALVNPRLGPQIFLGELITNLTLVSDKPVPESCPNCNQCVSACPTGALRPDGFLDATKCISYLTIESSDEIPSDLAPKIGNRLFGCAECLLACPCQQKAPPRENKALVFYPDRTHLDLNEILNLTESQFQVRFADSPLLRPGLKHIKHVAQICLKNLSV